jgi:two-component system, OmpR family, response regulator VanR
VKRRYIQKNFRISPTLSEELWFTIRTSERGRKRTGGNGRTMPNDTVIEIDDLVINKKRHIVTVRGKDKSLTPIEFSILALMASHHGQVFNVEQLYQNVWKEDKFLSDNTVMVHIRNIREKIEENPREPRYIKTVWGVGYKVE